jgi:hypothetical protein
MAAQPLDWVNTTIAALGLIGGGAGFIRAQVSAKRAEKAKEAAADAQADAAAALKKNSKNTKRIAKALEAMGRTWPGVGGIQYRGGPSAPFNKAAGLQDAGQARAGWAQALQALSVPVSVTWSLERRDGAPDTYRLRNDGDSDAKVVHVEGSPAAVSNLASIRGANGSTVDEVLAGSSVVVGVSNRLTLTVHEIMVWWSDADNNDAQSQTLQLPD